MTLASSLTIGQPLKDTVVDIDGNVYHTIKIGTQVWMVENLKVTHYRNGDKISNVKNSTQWRKLTTGAYCNYDNDPTNAVTYGRLYNWYAINDSRRIAPKGWHVSSDAEWNILEKYLDNSIDTTYIGWTGTDIGNKLKEAGTSHWFSGNSGTNSSNFTALPGGYRGSDGKFAGIRSLGYWWTAIVYGVTYTWNRSLGYGSATVGKDDDEKAVGFSLRCLKDN
ncbi:MAG: fibrobacter succinogenes major paralogous domain-containing protein [Bacteroidetes bacterium]|nr:fibrobacter succinogenes major paralogous domain-containing protein [Bacteroidota bacterium]